MSRTNAAHGLPRVLTRRGSLRRHSFPGNPPCRRLWAHPLCHRHGYGFEARPAVEPYGVLILTAADKLLNAGRSAPRVLYVGLRL